jgi:hypothetical protein
VGLRPTSFAVMLAAVAAGREASPASDGATSALLSVGATQPPARSEILVATRRGRVRFGAADVWRFCEELGQLVDVEQELAELGGAFGAELVCPGGLDLGDCLADHTDRRVAARG